MDSPRLKFPGELENAFRDDYFEKSLKPLRFATVFGMFLYAIFGLLDAWIIPQSKHGAWIIRYGVICPGCLLTLLLTYTVHFKKYMQLILSFSMIMAGGGILAIMVLAKDAGNYFYYSGLVLIIFYSYTFIKLRFVQATIVSWVLVALYDITALWLTDTPQPVFSYNNFIFISANLIGMFSSYQTERYIRKDFLQTLMVKELEEKRHFTEKEKLREAVDRATVSLRESEEKFRSLAETAPASIFIHQGGNFLYANPASESMIGYTHEEFLNMDFWGVTHPEDRDTIMTRARARLRGDRAPQRYELRIVTKSGETRWLDLSAGVIEYQGKPSVIGTAFDITARKNAEEEKTRLYEESVRQYQQRLDEEKRHAAEKEGLYEALKKTTASLQESEERFRTLAETTAAAIFITQGGKLLYANPAGETLTGYTHEELLSMDFWDFTHPDYRELLRERGLARLKGESPPRQYELKVLRKDGGERWVDLTAGLVEYEGKPAVIGTFFDITGRKQAEEERASFLEESVRQTRERMEEEKRHLREKEKILRDIHDGIGGITTNINLLAELARNTPAPADVRKTLSTIAELSRDGISEIRGFLYSLDSKDITWHTLFAELRNLGSTMVESHGIAFEVKTVIEDVQEQPGSLLCMTLYRIYKEALTNVIKHAKAGEVRADLVITKEWLELSIQDNGIGLDKGRTGGRGLLNMKTRAEELGGRVTTHVDGGTQVLLRIPLPVNYPERGGALPQVH